MRITVLALAGALAVCLMNPASAATKRTQVGANPDRSVYPASASYAGSGYNYRSTSQKIQKHKKNH